MTDDRMALLEMAEKGGDLDFLCELVQLGRPRARGRGGEPALWCRTPRAQ